ncbi:MAG TPA: carboxypeptidase-like regulatory domain-containing protein [Stellaceae bacterium]
MPGQTALQVIDANGNPVAGAAVTMPGSSFNAKTDKTGAATLPVGGGQALTMRVTHPNFVTEDVAFKPDVATGKWNNALVSRTASGGNASLRLQLGRCAVVPTVVMSDSDVEALAKKPASAADPKAALLFEPPAHPGLHAYRFQWWAEWDTRCARKTLLPTSTPAATAKGWDRFQTETVKGVQPANHGRFFWLTYPQQPADNQFVVAVWSANLPENQKNPVSTLDMWVFYSPTTQTYQGNYPFGLVPDPHGGPANQPYMSLASRYLLNEYGFIYETAAKDNPAVLVMPICRRGDWGPFASAEGVYRLLREVAVFLQRECRTSFLGRSQKGYVAIDGLAGASLRDPKAPGIEADDFGQTPAVGSVGVGFFSTGAAPAKQVMATRPGGGVAGGLNSQLWGTPAGSGADPNAAWTASWTELWDMDGFHPNTGGWTNYVKLLGQWYGQSSSRKFRLCHSSGRSPPDPKTSSDPFWQSLVKAGLTVDQTVPASGAFGTAHELQGTRWAAVRFDNSYIDGGAQGVYPELYGKDAHHATCVVGFSYGRALTSL